MTRQGYLRLIEKETSVSKSLPGTVSTEPMMYTEKALIVEISAFFGRI